MSNDHTIPEEIERAGETVNTERPPMAVLGIGGAGVKIVNLLASLPRSGIKLAVADSDQQSLDNSVLPENLRFAMGIEWTQGMGCGGNTQRGARAFSHSQSKLESFVKNSPILFVTGGLGGGTATGGGPVVGRLARRLSIPAVCIFSMPFSFEGHGRRGQAESGIQQLLPDADVVIPVPNDLLFSTLPASTPADTAFRKADEALAEAISCLARIFQCRNLLSADFAELKEALGKRKSVCAIGYSSMDAPREKRIQTAIEALINSPLLGGVKRLGHADAVVLSVIGGPDLEIGELKQSLEIIQEKTAEKCNIITGANTDPAFAGKISLAAIVIQYDKNANPIPDHEFTPAIPRPTLVPPGNQGSRDMLDQGELNLFPFSKGIFSGSRENSRDGEDLDIPTFQRRKITLDKGK